VGTEELWDRTCIGSEAAWQVNEHVDVKPDSSTCCQMAAGAEQCSSGLAEGNNERNSKNTTSHTGGSTAPANSNIFLQHNPLGLQQASVRVRDSLQTVYHAELCGWDVHLMLR
jgi:hypothetical protein